MTSRAFSFHVWGRVQGVGFRWSTKEEAARLALAGWVLNEDDGSVSGIVQGGDQALETFRSWLNRGPASAKVDHVDWLPQEPTSLRLFTVR